ncbi:MAG: hypothetical protein WAO58_08885 [Fimbriimonadaceae bacterium]
MSLSQDPAFSLLKNDFVVGTRDITGEPWSGFSGTHSLEAGAVVTTNGAGPHNIQMFVMAPDKTVLTVLPGYWNPEDLAFELKVANELYAVWKDPKLTRAQKDAKFAAAHLGHITDHPQAMVRRSQMQGFDQKFEAKQRLASSDTILSTTGGKMGGPVFKTTDVIFHERLARQPFAKYEEFDVVSFSDYGRAKYDKKEEGSGPVVDLRPETTAKQKQRQLMLEKRKQQMQNRQKRGGRKG